MITLIGGTNRAGSNTRKIAGLIEEIHLQAGAEARLLDLIEMPAACFRPEAYGTRPTEFAPMAQAVLAHGAGGWLPRVCRRLS